MILTDLYVLRHNVGTKHRMDCVASTESYPQFEALRNTERKLFVYLGDSQHTEAGKKGKADMALSKTKHISSIYRPDVESCLGWGDMKDTSDALLFVFHSLSIVNNSVSDGAIVEVFVARGMSKDRQTLYQAFADGELDTEIEALRKQANSQLSI